MATISVTAANMIPSADAVYVLNNPVAYETVTAGQVAYLHSGGRYGLADANGVADTNTVVGIFANGASAGQRVNIVSRDPNLVLGGTLTLGKILVLGATPGQIVEAGDQATGWHVVTLGICMSTTVLDLYVAPTPSSAIA